MPADSLPFVFALFASVIVASTQPSAADLAPRFVQVQAAAPSEQPARSYEGWPKDKLLAERDRLDHLRPSRAPTLLFMIGGGALVVVSAYTLFLGYLGVSIDIVAGGLHGQRLDVGVLIFCAVLAAIGIVGFAVGGFVFAPKLNQGAPLTREIRRIDKAIEASPQKPHPPPPPVPVTGQQVSLPPSFGATVTLARF